MALEDLLDRTREEVLALDPDPLDVAAGEVDVAAIVAIAEVAGVEHPTARAGRGRSVVLVIALEHARARGVHDLADRLLRVHEATGGVEACRRAFVAARVEDRHPGRRQTERARRI